MLPLMARDFVLQDYIILNVRISHFMFYSVAVVHIHYLLVMMILLEVDQFINSCYKFLQNANLAPVL